jgi:hypothetical protein
MLGGLLGMALEASGQVVEAETVVAVMGKP